MERPRKIFEPEARKIARKVLPHDADTSSFATAREQLSTLHADSSLTPDARQVIGAKLTDLAIREGRADDFRNQSRSGPEH